LIFATAVGSLIVSYNEKISNLFNNILSTKFVISFIIFFVIFFTTITLKYFADRQRSILFATRKVIILRRMLGLTYGTMQLILPNWRIEGADQPLSVRLFPGWSTYVAYPFYILSIMSSIIIVALILTLKQLDVFFINYISLTTSYLSIILFIIFFLFYMYIYRMALLDIHERPLYIFTKNISKMINLKLVNNFEYIIYRAKLAKYETNRQKIDLSNLKKLLIFIEDKEFKGHIGISLKGITRGIKSVLGNTSKAGGSTITQQMVRTLFISDIHKTYRRKIIEILLAIWVNKVISKEEQLEIYLSAVRFEKGVFGITEAMKYFWNQLIKEPTNAQSFFLIERVSNIKSRLLINKIVHTINNAKQKNILQENDIIELVNLYDEAIKNNKIVATSNDIEILKNKLKIFI
jgi:penicillin-binding protein 1A